MLTLSLKKWIDGQLNIPLHKAKNVVFAFLVYDYYKPLPILGMFIWVFGIGILIHVLFACDSLIPATSCFAEDDIIGTMPEPSQ